MASNGCQAFIDCRCGCRGSEDKQSCASKRRPCGMWRIGSKTWLPVDDVEARISSSPQSVSVREKMKDKLWMSEADAYFLRQNDEMLEKTLPKVRAKIEALMLRRSPHCPMCIVAAHTPSSSMSSRRARSSCVLTHMVLFVIYLHYAQIRADIATDSSRAVVSFSLLPRLDIRSHVR